jgi:sugar phosphate isomerase/epimerase
MARLISFAAGNAPDFDCVDFVTAAAKAGWPACGIWYDPESWSVATTRAIKRVFDDSGMIPLDIEVIFMRPGPTEASHLKMIEVGAEIGAKNALIVSMDPDFEAVKAKFAALSAFALSHGVTPNFEFLPILEVRTLDAAMAVIADAPGAGLMPDLLHLIRSGGSVADLARVPLERLHYAQICDGPAAVEADKLLEDAMDGRVMPGEGALPAVAFMKALPTALPLSLEIRGKALRDDFPDIDGRARHMLKEARRFFEAYDVASPPR